MEDDRDTRSSHDEEKGRSSEYFFERDNILKKIHEAFKKSGQPSSKNVNLPRPRLVLLTGGPGVGKTMVAKNFCESHYCEIYKTRWGVKTIFHIEANSHANLRAGFKSLCAGFGRGDHLKIPTLHLNLKEMTTVEDTKKLCRHLYDYLLNNPFHDFGQCLFVLDQVGGWEEGSNEFFGISPFLPLSRSGRSGRLDLLIISRNGVICPNPAASAAVGPMEQVKMDKLDPSDVFNYLRHTFSSNDECREEEDNNLKKKWQLFTESMGGYPLAVTLMVTAMKANGGGKKLSTFLKDLDDHLKKFETGCSDYSAIIFEIMDLTLKKFENDPNPRAPESFVLIQKLAYIASCEVEMDMCGTVFRGHYPPHEYREDEVDEDEVDWDLLEVLQVAEKYGLITIQHSSSPFEDKETFSIHMDPRVREHLVKRQEGSPTHLLELAKTFRDIYVQQYTNFTTGSTHILSLFVEILHLPLLAQGWPQGSVEMSTIFGIVSIASMRGNSSINILDHVKKFYLDFLQPPPTTTTLDEMVPNREEIWVAVTMGQIYEENFATRTPKTFLRPFRLCGDLLEGSTLANLNDAAYGGWVLDQMKLYPNSDPIFLMAMATLYGLRSVHVDALSADQWDWVISYEGRGWDEIMGFAIHSCPFDEKQEMSWLIQVFVQKLHRLMETVNLSYGGPAEPVQKVKSSMWRVVSSCWETLEGLMTRTQRLPEILDVLTSQYVINRLAGWQEKCNANGGQLTTLLFLRPHFILDIFKNIFKSGNQNHRKRLLSSPTFANCFSSMLLNLSDPDKDERKGDDWTWTNCTLDRYAGFLKLLLCPDFAPSELVVGMTRSWNFIKPFISAIKKVDTFFQDQILRGYKQEWTVFDRDELRFQLFLLLFSILGNLSKDDDDDQVSQKILEALLNEMRELNGRKSEVTKIKCWNWNPQHIEKFVKQNADKVRSSLAILNAVLIAKKLLKIMPEYIDGLFRGEIEI